MDILKNEIANGMLCDMSRTDLAVVFAESDTCTAVLDKPIQARRQSYQLPNILLVAYVASTAMWMSW